jgi:hypothetical protein
MKSFQTIVLSTALILLIVILTAFAILLRTSKGDLIYPPILSVCPDGWRVSGNECEPNPDLKCKDQGQGSFTTEDSNCCNNINILDYKKMSYDEKKKKFKEDCPNGSWDGLTNLDYGADKHGTDDSDSGLRIKKQHVIIILLIIFTVGYFVFL